MDRIVNYLKFLSGNENMKFTLSPKSTMNNKKITRVFKL